MKKEGSTASMLWLDIRRGFCSKRFWGIVGVVTIVFVVFLTLDIIYPLQKYYNGYGTFDWKLDSISMAPFAVRIGILSMDLFITFFPFIGVIAYAGTIIDERKDGYCYQIIQKRGFHSYYWSHFVASGLLGGLLAVTILISLYLLTDIGIGQNPLWRDAIQVYLTPEFGSENETVYFGIHILTKSAGHVELVLLGMVSFFLTGCLFGLLGAIIAFVSDARVLVYAMPMIIMETGCGGLYAISLLFGRDSVAANVLAYFYNITGAYISFGNLLSRCIVIFLIILMLCIGKGMESKVVRYYLGEEIRQV